jgi:hypothetical protein
MGEIKPATVLLPLVVTMRNRGASRTAYDLSNSSFQSMYATANMVITARKPRTAIIGETSCTSFSAIGISPGQ